MILRSCIICLFLSLKAFTQDKSKPATLSDFINCKYVQGGCGDISLTGVYSEDSLMKMFFFKIGDHGTILYFDLIDSVMVGYQDLEKGLPNGLSITRNDSHLISTMMFNPLDNQSREYEYHTYYPSGILKESGNSYLGGSFKIGKWRYYNEKGILLRELNYVIKTTEEGYLKSELEGAQRYYVNGKLEKIEYYEKGSHIRTVYK